MANYQQNPANGNQDPAGSTQMFRAFVDEGAPQGGGRQAARQQQSSGPRIGVIVGVIVAIAVVVGAAWLALS
ncbi:MULTISPECIES: hypothetical protein [Streptomyces]|uniref:Uncharacterized protein n=2 Tax=Streptomyces rimosus subsp. rimosus TaxID=132474 RepID=L8EKQ5_STRR1|nr:MULTISPECIES: hypothetical protein [Streptomyces]KOG69752.1 membrane protein [Kitasatospora aureofaciens]MYT44625.1 hypothetical protein [Streptomyces sp. SID5471]KEF02403.1 membrane protein [Streptomyces rimosus]KEF18420.1 membrane protein [Streptomyces rimosus]KOT26819.1 membrane protein [Streptomyces rimosus subsp. rimosus]